MPVLYLTEEEVSQILSIDLALDAVSTAFRKLAIEEAVNIPRQRCQTDHVMLHILPAAAKTLGILGYKAYTTTKSASRFHVMLYDGKNGQLTAIIEADLLGQFRTGAASGVATKKLARANATTVGCLGTGKQARTQLLAICKVRPIQRIHVYGRDSERRNAFAANISRETGVEVTPVQQPEEAVKNLDIIVTATTAREPILFGDWVSDGQHLNLIGSNFLAKSEADIEVFRKANLVVVDSKEQAKMEAGDFVAPINAGILQWVDILELAPLLVNRYPGRENDRDITIFKSLGIGIEDLALAVKVLELARTKGLGREIF
jgi:ornithine cyclodeaminase/alanine dehydrogenase-like protein (mu-crystallin family)